MQRDTEKMNLPQPGTSNTKGRKEQTSALKTSWGQQVFLPPVHQLASHTQVCVTRARTERPLQASVLLLGQPEFSLQSFNPGIHFLVRFSVIFLANAPPRPHIVNFLLDTISSHLRVLHIFFSSSTDTLKLANVLYFPLPPVFFSQTVLIHTRFLCLCSCDAVQN